MTVVLSIIGMLVLLLVWSLAWRTQPVLAIGIFIGIAVVGVIALFLRPSGLHLEHIPLWLPPLPFATVAVALFVFGTLAWWWGRSRS